MLRLINIEIFMKPIPLFLGTFAFALLFVGQISHCAAADNRDREARIGRMVKSQLGSAMRAENLPAAASTLQFVRQTNPSLTETQWSEIMDEVNDVMTTGMSQRGNPMFSAYEKLLGSFSDAELSKLEQLLGDPIYRKYSSALVSTVAQQALMQGFIENSPWMPQALNLALRKRGLKEVH
jgi:hypothetical protein